MKKKNEIIGKIAIIDGNKNLPRCAWVEFPRFPYRMDIPITKKYKIKGTSIEVEEGSRIKLTVIKKFKKRPKKSVTKK